MTELNQLRFSKTHEWLRLDAKTGTVGITEHAQEEISDVVFVELPKVGRAVRQGEEVAVVESVKAAFSIYSPVSGTISKVNDGLVKDPGAINRSPYEEGWIFLLDGVDGKDLINLLTREQYDQWVKGEEKH
ncbi:MAG: glycine cleavage system protein GcvH [Candidatus Omnitrophica bacterium]|nr:glycine cleavage system protein GcvH [Candidatus Omnitrophota bacterium]